MRTEDESIVINDAFVDEISVVISFLIEFLLLKR